MCDVCADFVDLLQSYAERVSKEISERPILSKAEVETVFLYLQSWSQRQCLCCFRDAKNFERFNLVTQSIICLAVCQLRELHQDLLHCQLNLKYGTEKNPKTASEDGQQNVSNEGTLPQKAGGEAKVGPKEDASLEVKEEREDDSSTGEGSAFEGRLSADDSEELPEVWNMEEREKLFQFLSKVFLLNFPLYVAYKHSVQSKVDELSQQEASNLSAFCDLHDPEIPVYLLRNVCLFCKSGGVRAMTFCFEGRNPETLPVPLAHTMMAVVCNLKLWLNFRSIVQLFVPLRSKVLRYMCCLGDKDLRLPGIKTMADFMWSAVKDPLESPLTFDKDGLDLAFKYFTSPTLTMRLAGIAQINSNINLFNEMCNNDSIIEVENVGQNLANWLIENQIISHIFGPNLHVEVIKQSHIILSFLAMEGKITDDHIDIVWQALQLKHCSKQVHDLLPPLIKNLEAGPVLHLYGLLCKMEPKDHTEQSLYLASALIKFIWTSGGSCSGRGIRPPTSLANLPLGHPGARDAADIDGHADTSSSENSVSVEASNSEDEQPDSSQQSEGQKSPSDGSDRTRSCKQPLKPPIEEEVKTPLDNSSESLKAKLLECGNEKLPKEMKDPCDAIEEAFKEVSKEEKERTVEFSGSEVEKKEDKPEESVKVNDVAVESVKKVCASEEIVDDKDMDADAEKSGGEESPADGKRKLYRKRKKGCQGKERNSYFKKERQVKLLVTDSCETVKEKKNKGQEDEDEEEEEEEDMNLGEEKEEEEDAESSSEVSSKDNAIIIHEVMSSHTESCNSTSKNKLEVNSMELDQQVPNVVISEVMEEAMTEEEGSYSSRMSNKSEKNMADFDGEESGCEDELVQLAARARVHMGSHISHQGGVVTFHPHFCSRLPPSLAVDNPGIVPRGLFSNFKADDVCRPGSTLIWDLLQDDKIVQLGEGLALEAEKALCNLLCFNTDRLIRMKFIEGCLENLSKNETVVVSLRLLPKLFASFQQFRGMDTHRVTAWAEKEHNMMSHFFNNLKVYMTEGSKVNLYTHQTEVQVRLQFLTSIYSAVGSADSFKLSVEQVDVLWDCLASDHRCSDDLFTWFLAQCRWGRESGGERPHHALTSKTLEHLYLRKLPMLRPESMGMTALSLFQRLCDLARPNSERNSKRSLHGEADSSGCDSSVCENEDIVGMDHMWKIALRADSTDVSMSAIQYLNAYYVGHRLEHEREFVTQCMAHLAAASADLEKRINEEASLLCIQRALLLLRTHLETFRKRYAYHLRRWALEDEVSKGSFGMVQERVGAPLRVLIRPAGTAEKVTMELNGGDYIADLRAEVTHWWETMQQARRKNNGAGEGSSGLQNATLQEGPIRMITQGQELTTDFDEKTLLEMGIKDLQLVFISTGVPRPRKVGRRDSGEAPSSLPPPPKDSLPTTLLLQPPYFDQLFSLMQTLGCMETWDRAGYSVPHTKAQVLSRRVWDILALLPTSPTLLKGFRELNSGPNEPSLRDLLDPEGPQKLMYSLRIVESLCRQGSRITCSSTNDTAASSNGANKENIPQIMSWSQKFIKCGGLRHLFDIFMSGILQRGCSSGVGGKGAWEWQLDCLASLLGLLCRLGTSSQNTLEGSAGARGRSMTSGEDVSEMSQGGKRLRNRPIRAPSSSGKSSNGEYPAVVGLEEPMLQMMDVRTVLPRLTSILCEVSLPRDPNHYETGFWGRAQVVHHATSLLVSWAHSQGHEENVRASLLSCPQFPLWLRRLVLEDPEPAVRREACTAVYRLCLGPKGSHSGNITRANAAAAPVLALLLRYLEVAEGMRPSYHGSEALRHHSEDGKEAYGPACRDYFWLLCRLVDGLPEDVVKDSIEDPQDCPVDLEGLAKKLVQSVTSRDYLETRHNTVEDDGLIGLINLMSNVLKHNPPFKNSKTCQDFLCQVFDYLFALPNPRKRHVPKCKSRLSRSSAYDLLVEMVKGSPENYRLLHEKLLSQHQPDAHAPYPWDYWPHEDGRSDCGYVGLTNLGATCYMASCMQHLYMMPQARLSILSAQCSSSEKSVDGEEEGSVKVDQETAVKDEGAPKNDSNPAKVGGPGKHEQTLREMQRMFAYLMESERKAYNPRSFCRVYTMDHQPLNTGEQKDMAEFFIDLVSKLEEMTPELKKLVKTLFCGVISNNVVSLDCPHVSRTLEEFYTVRCQVADMRNLYESLDEVTVKDTLEGDNMYTCSQCGKKVRAEKRACFKKLPHILCFNTMRYTFNMVTMTKEKVNTHFSFPLRLNMAGYMEKNLLPQHYQEDKEKLQKKMADGEKNSEDAEDSKIESRKDVGGMSSSDKKSEVKEEKEEEPETSGCDEHHEYDLIGVTVHTGTADGGHYYSFIRDRSLPGGDKWFLFNDAEVKPFDPDQIAAECFGGEMTSKTYDSVTDKFMDFSFEKTNSAYMLFYEWCGRGAYTTLKKEEPNHSANVPVQNPLPPFELSKELEDWIWRDNMHFLRDKNIFEHTYFHFMWQVCGHVPQTLPNFGTDITEMAAKLSTSFFVETFIHAKEKPTMVQWVELLTKQFNSSQAACEWFLDHMATHDCWPVRVLVRCPNQMVRQMFHRLCIHVIQRLRHTHAPLYLKPIQDGPEAEINPKTIGEQSCVTRFIKMLLSLLEHGAKAHLKHLTEYFAFLYDYGKMGEEEGQFLIAVGAISAMVNFYLGQKMQEHVEVVSEEEDEEEEEEEDVISLPTDKTKPASLEKMIALVAVLVEKSRGEDHRLGLLPGDLNAVAGGKGFPFLYQQIKDNINLHQTSNLIYALSRWNERLASHIVGMIFQAITKHTEVCQPFFKLLTLLMEGGNGTGLPCFTQLVLQRVWEAAEACPQSALGWLAVQAPRNKLVHAWVLQSLDTWVEHFLISHANQRVRAAAALLLVSLVPSVNFRQGFRAFRGTSVGLSRPGDPSSIVAEATPILHRIYSVLLRLLKPARLYIDIQAHGTSKLTAYFALLTYCAISKVEKLMFGPYFVDLWQLFHPKLAEPSIPVHHNKQAVLLFWHHVCTDCPENVQLILQNPHVTKNIAFNYILADHNDQDVVQFNRAMLPAYYGLLRTVCEQSRGFCRHLAAHQNIHWAFKNITPYPTQYSTAVEELFKLMQLFVLKRPDSTEQELREIATFRRQTLQLYLEVLDGRSCWATLITALRTLIDSDDDRLFVIYNNGFQMLFEALHTLHVMHHEATACHVGGDLQELLAIMLDMARCLRTSRDGHDARNILLSCKEWADALRKLATLLNTYNPPEMRTLCIELLKEFLLLLPAEVVQVLAPLLSHCHAALQDGHRAIPVPVGPYFPRRGSNHHKSSIVTGPHIPGPRRPMVQMAVPHSQLEAAKGVDEEYDEALMEVYSPYHQFVDVMCRLAVNNECMSETLVGLSAMLGFEGVPLHMTFFPKLWLDIFHAQHVDRKYISVLTNSNYFVDYVEAVLLDERTSLNNGIVYNFLCIYFPKVASHVLNEQTCNLIDSLVSSLTDIAEVVSVRATAYKLNGDLRALSLVYGSGVGPSPPPSLANTLAILLNKARACQRQIEDVASTSSAPSNTEETSNVEGDEPPTKKRIMDSQGNTKEEHLPKPSSPTPGSSKSLEEPAQKPSEAADNSAQNQPRSAFCVNWVEVLEKTIIGLLAILGKKG